MNGEDYKELSETVSEHGYTVEPTPETGENVRFFDIISHEGEIPTARLLGTVHTAIERRQLGITPEVIAAQANRVTFEDLSAVNLDL